MSLYFKGFDKDFCFEGKKYEVGKTYVTGSRTADVLSPGDIFIRIYYSGVDFWWNPYELLRRFPPKTSRYAVVQMEGEMYSVGEDAPSYTSMTILREVNINDLLLNLDEYQRLALMTAGGASQSYLVLGLASESGEVAGAYKKFMRGDYGENVCRERMKDELGDVLWYLSQVSLSFGFNMTEIAESNLEKIMKRKDSNKIKGDGER